MSKASASWGVRADSHSIVSRLWVRFDAYNAYEGELIAEAST
jgi:hypothetical protein